MKSPAAPEIYRALQKCIIYTILSNGDCGRSPQLLLGRDRVNVRNRPASIGKAGHDDGRSNERPSEAPDAVGCDRRPAQAVDSRRDLSGRLAAAAGRAGRCLRRQPHSGARSAVSARGRRAGAYRPAKGRDRLGAVAGRNQRRVRSARDHGAAAFGAVGAALYGTGLCRAGRHPEALREGDQGGQCQRVGAAQCRLPYGAVRSRAAAADQGDRHRVAADQRPLHAPAALQHQGDGDGRKRTRPPDRAMPGATDRRGLPVSGAAYRGGADRPAAGRRRRLDRARAGSGEQCIANSEWDFPIRTRYSPFAGLIVPRPAPSRGPAARSKSPGRSTAAAPPASSAARRAACPRSPRSGEYPARRCG